MKITIEHEGDTISLSTQEVCCKPIMIRIIDLLSAVGYHKKVIDESLCDLAEEIIEMRKEND